MTFQSTLLWSNEGDFLGEFRYDEAIPVELYQQYPLHLDRRGDNLVCREHPMMSPMPDLVIEWGYLMPRRLARDIAVRWWNDTYNDGEGNEGLLS